MRRKPILLALAVVLTVTFGGYRCTKNSRAAKLRQEVVLNLWLKRDITAVPALISHLRDPDDLVRTYAIRGLEALSDPRAVEPAIALLSDNDNGVRHAAIHALGSLGDPRAAGPLVERLDNGEDSLIAVLDAIARVGRPCIGPLLARFPPGKARPFWATLALAVCGEPAARAVVLDAIENDSYSRQQKQELLQYWVPALFKAEIETATNDPALRLAARAERLGADEWDVVLHKAVHEPSLITITALATEYAPKNLRRSWLTELLERCLKRGDLRAIPALIAVLTDYGDTWHAELYLNCGNPELATAAREWSREHHESLSQDSRYYPRWASERAN